jgi:hypothetical protein
MVGEEQIRQAADQKGITWKAAFDNAREQYDKERYSARLDQQADRIYRQRHTKTEHVEVIFRWYKDGTLKDAEHFFAQIPDLLRLSGNLTTKQANRLRRIQANYLAAQPDLVTCRQNIQLKQYLETLRKITDEVKSVIFTLANQLTKTMDRKSAFQEAWRVAKAGGLKVPVAGVSFGNRQEALHRLNRYDPKDIHMVLVPEPENPHDPNAIAVKVGVQNGKGLFTIGYVPRNDTKAVKAVLGKVTPRLKVICAETASAQLVLAV